MDYLTIFVLGIIGGLILSLFLRATTSDKITKTNTDLLATKEDVKRVTREIEKLKHNYDLTNLANAEREFYDENEVE